MKTIKLQGKKSFNIGWYDLLVGYPEEKGMSDEENEILCKNIIDEYMKMADDKFGKEDPFELDDFRVIVLCKETIYALNSKKDK